MKTKKGLCEKFEFRGEFSKYGMWFLGNRIEKVFRKNKIWVSQRKLERNSQMYIAEERLSVRSLSRIKGM